MDLESQFPETDEHLNGDGSQGIQNFLCCHLMIHGSASQPVSRTFSSISPQYNRNGGGEESTTIYEINQNFVSTNFGGCTVSIQHG